MIFRKYWFVLIPLLLGISAGAALNFTPLSNPIVFLRADIGTVVFVLGLILSTLLALIFFVKYQLDLIENNALEEAARDRRRFLSLLDHELKNPLTAIMAGLANLTSVDQQPTIDSVQTQVQRLSRLVADLRKLSDLETRTIELSRVSLPNLLKDVYELSKDRVRSQRIITLTTPQAPWPLPDILADHDLLFLAIHNVIDNAIKFTKTGDTIEIRASEDGSNVRIEIADTGPGIPADEIDQVWVELFRGKGARGIQGSGLGLALVQAIIRRHGGTVAIRSQIDKGTVITISLPVRNVTEL
ncbi:MAG: HAMP domain-containing sensor histidine kinase [Anaerolineales bacterium]|jgi:two-component system OmpR family sensor kinase